MGGAPKATLVATIERRPVVGSVPRPPPLCRRPARHRYGVVHALGAHRDSGHTHMRLHSCRRQHVPRSVAEAAPVYLASNLRPSYAGRLCTRLLVMRKQMRTTASTTTPAATMTTTTATAATTAPPMPGRPPPSVSAGRRWGRKSFQSRSQCFSHRGPRCPWKLDGSGRPEKPEPR